MKTSIRLLAFFGVYLLVAYISASPVAITIADPGELDDTFGSGGYVTHDDVKAKGLAFNAAEKILVVGGMSGCSSVDAMLGRLNADGSADESFGDDVDGDGVVDGLTYYDKDSGYDITNALVQDEDGNIIVAGRSTDSSSDMDGFLKKYDADGQAFVTTFGAGGVVEVDLGSGTDLLKDLVIDTNGKLLAVGYATNSSSTAEILLTRHESDGTADATFDTVDADGLVQYGYGSAGSSANGLALLYNEDQTDYQIIVVGSGVGASGTQDAVILKFDGFGTVDSTFASGAGAIEKDFFAAGDAAYAVTVDSDNNIYVAGQLTDATADRDIFVAKFAEDGTIDDGFGSSGYSTFDSGLGHDMPEAIELDDFGNLIVTGYVTKTSGPENDILLARFDSAGNIDTTFGDVDGDARSGFALLDVSGSDAAHDLVVSGNDIYIAGVVDSSLSGGKLIVAKFQGGSVECGDGDIDTGEECDDGNTDAADGCSDTCTTEVDADGDGYYADVNDCDDNDASIFEGCPVCGDGVIEGDEECDDGNTHLADGCSDTCTTEIDADGDGFYVSVNDCDDTDPSQTTVCDGEGIVTCGDGAVEGDEQCDDGNITDGDGCSAECLDEETDEDPNPGESTDYFEFTGGGGCSLTHAPAPTAVGYFALGLLLSLVVLRRRTDRRSAKQNS